MIYLAFDVKNLKHFCYLLVTDTHIDDTILITAPPHMSGKQFANTLPPTLRLDLYQ